MSNPWAVGIRAVPFEAIPLGDVPPKQFDEREIGQLQFLGLEQEITYMPSLQVLEDRLRARSQIRLSGTTTFVGFGDPVIGAPTLRQEISNFGDWLFRSESAQKSLSRLPKTDSEIRKLQKIFGGRDADIYLRERATIESFWANEVVSKAEVLAFATHAVSAGLSNGQVVDEPFLLMSSEDERARGLPEEVRLKLTEILSMDIDAKLVLLSACSTASSDGAFAGSGLSGLVRDFMIAGAENVLASLWDVESRSSFYLTTYFAAEARKKDVTLGRALLNAKKGFLERIFQASSLLERLHPYWRPQV